MLSGCLFGLRFEELVKGLLLRVGRGGGVEVFEQVSLLLRIEERQHRNRMSCVHCVHHAAEHGLEMADPAVLWFPASNRSLA